MESSFKLTRPMRREFLNRCFEVVDHSLIIPVKVDDGDNETLMDEVVSDDKSIPQMSTEDDYWGFEASL
jgi:hypothetical protein